MIPRFIKRGTNIAVVTNDLVTKEDAERIKRSGLIAPERVMAVETGACPHTAIREDPTLNIQAADLLDDRFKPLDLILIESGGDNLASTFSLDLVDYWLFVIDVAGGDDIPRKRGPGVLLCDLLIINKTDLAPYVRVDLDRHGGRGEAGARRQADPAHQLRHGRGCRRGRRPALARRAVRRIAMPDGLTKVVSIDGEDARGRLELAFARDPSGRTYLRRQFASYPYHVCRPLSFGGDPQGMATIYLQSSAGGIFRDDRLREHIVAEEGVGGPCDDPGLNDRAQHGPRRRPTGGADRGGRRQLHRGPARSLHSVPAVAFCQRCPSARA